MKTTMLLLVLVAHTNKNIILYVLNIFGVIVPKKKYKYILCK